ncbi:MAG: hypothetical protein K940chlam7_02087 [Chlamydiae bacterium]|nr:hypothetical protein [Chlamydiota bacterium]
MSITKRKLSKIAILVALLSSFHGFCLENCCEEGPSVTQEFSSVSDYFPIPHYPQYLTIYQLINLYVNDLKIK